MNDPSPTQDQRGFSLVELLVTLLIIASVLGSVLTLSNMAQSRQNFEQDLVAIQQSAREAVDQMCRDIRLAGYPQERIYAASTGWTPANSNEVASGFTTINSNDLIFQGDINNDGIVEVVEYTLNGSNLVRSEVQKNSNGTIPAADLQILAENVTGLTFTYYRWDQAANSWSTSGVTTSNATRVDVSLTVQTVVQDPNSKQYRSINVQASVVARNL